MMELHTDIYYIEKVKGGDTASFSYLLDKYSSSVYSLIFRIVRNREDAEELSQDVFVKVYRNISSFKGESDFSTWIYRIAYNTAISKTRRKKQEYLVIEESMLNNVSEEEVVELWGHTDESNRLEALERALSQLLPEEQMLMHLFYMQEKTIAEIAFIAGLTVSHVKVKLHRIRKKVFVLLK